MFEPILNIISLLKTIIGVGIVIKVTQLFDAGYISNGLIEGINLFTAESPELITYLVFLVIGLKFMR